jgi:DHA2 family multidrug resistance protein
MTPNTGEDDMYWALILRGIRLLFVPITTLSLSTLSGKNIGEGAAFTGMMRQLGSFGIAIITTLSRFSQEHRVNLVAHLDGTKFEVQQRYSFYKRIYVKRIYRKMKKAYQAIDYSVMKQSTVLSYMDIFLYLEFYFCAVFQLYS